MSKKKLIFYWCIHHRLLLEPKTEPIKNRIKFIKENKPQHEISMRLKCLKKVKGKLPNEIYKAWDAYYKAEDAYAKAWGAYYKAEDAYYKAEDAYDKAKAEDAYDKAWDAYYKAEDAYYKAADAYDKILVKHKKYLLKLHAKECPDCKFDWDDGIIFEEKK